LLILLLTALIVAMMSVFDGAPKSRVTRFLRRWAGLPTGTGGPSTASAASTTGSLGARTARADSTPGQETGNREPGNTPPT
jgi:hypothetical protein